VSGEVEAQGSSLNLTPLELWGEAAGAARARACPRSPHRASGRGWFWSASGRGVAAVEGVADALWPPPRLSRLWGASDTDSDCPGTSGKPDLSHHQKRIYFAPSIPARVLTNAIDSSRFYERDIIICIFDFNVRFWFEAGKRAVIFSTKGLHFGGERKDTGERIEERGFVRYEGLPLVSFSMDFHSMDTGRGHAQWYSINIDSKIFTVTSGPLVPALSKAINLLKIVISKHTS
jgi:hypothetical protein